MSRPACVPTKRRRRGRPDLRERPARLFPLAGAVQEYRPRFARRCRQGSRTNALSEEQRDYRCHDRKIGAEARRYANRIMAESNLAIVMVDGADLSVLGERPATILRPFEREARHAMNLKNSISRTGRIMTNEPTPTVCFRTSLGRIHHADSLDVMKETEKEAIDLIVTSPPFALTRKKDYGNEQEDAYLEWFEDFAQQFHRISERGWQPRYRPRRRMAAGTPGAQPLPLQAIDFCSVKNTTSTSLKNSIGGTPRNCRRLPNG